MIKLSVLLLSVLFLTSCSDNPENHNNQDNTKDSTLNANKGEGCKMPLTNHTHSNIDDVRTTHLHLDLDVNFDEKKIFGVARHQIEQNNNVGEVIFDVDGLKIIKITTGSNEKEEVEAEYEIGSEVEHLGAPLTVSINENTEQVNIYYETTDASNALDWLDPSLTMSKKHPFLYTQGQAVLTRTWIPIQDTPSNRITYSATLKVPSELLAVMSANNPTEKNEEGIYNFEMNQPIPSYLIAMAVGDLAYRKLGENSGVYAEQGMVDDAAEEFVDIPKMMDAAQKLYGEYLWDIYDVIVLPHSFPFGGMENPRLTFATPTLIAGDRSLVSVIAHELAHSWSGNLVTNATWNDIWLNEGFTVYFENRIMEEIYGKEISDMLLLIEYQELIETIEHMMSRGKNTDTHLKLDLDCRNPDDGLTDVAYVKGALFLKTLEEEATREEFDKFLTQYFNENKFKTITTEDFVTYLNEHLIDKNNLEFNTEEWIYGEGLPDNCITLTSPRFMEIQLLAKTIKNDNARLPKDLKRSDKITQEWQAFIRTFNYELAPSKMEAIDKQLKFTESGNAEIMSEWFVLGIKSGYTKNYDAIEKFLLKVGRRKFLEPIYTALAASEENKKWALEVYEKARPNYHAVSFKTIDKILGIE